MSSTSIKMSKKQQRETRKKNKMEAFLQIANMNDGDIGKGKKRPFEKHLPESGCGGGSITGTVCPSDDDSSEDTSKKKSKLSTTGKPWLSGSDLVQLRARMRERRKLVMQKPKLYLCLDKMLPGLHPAYREEDNYIQHRSPEEPGPLFVRDLQHLLLYAIEGNVTNYKPRWCKLLRWQQIKQVVVVVMDNVSLDDCKEYKDSLSFLHQTFDMHVELMSPCQYGSSVAAEMFRVPLSRQQIRRKYFTLDEQINPQTTQIINHTFSEMKKQHGKLEGHLKDKFNRLELLLGPDQMMLEGYPMPVQNKKYADFVFSKASYEQVKENSPMFAVDCEMCLTSIGDLEVTRIAVVSEALDMVYTSLVKPKNRIINYLTQYSGITPQLMKYVTTSLEDVQHALQELLPPDAILVGQSLNGDLCSLKMFHPYVIDTSVIYNLSGVRKIKPGLKRLTAHFLGKVIQNEGASGHDPIEDAAAAMELVLHKLQHEPFHGDMIFGGDATLDDHSNNQSVTNCNSQLDRRRAFFQHHGLKLYDSLFELCKRSNKSAVVVGPKKELQSCCDQNHLRLTDGDRSTVKVLTKELESNFLVWAQFHHLSLEDSIECTADNIQGRLSKMDRRLRKIFEKVLPDSLFVVIAAGRKVPDKGFNHNASAFLTLTGKLGGLETEKGDVS